MNGKNIEVPEGKTLLLFGGNAEDRLRLAGQAAEGLGIFWCTVHDEIKHPEAIEQAIRAGVKTIIVDCETYQLLYQTPGHIKAAITNERIPVKLDGKAISMEKPPRFIFCTGQMDTLQLKNLGQRFHPVLCTSERRRARPELNKGRILAIVGPQGSGKTIMARSIAGELGAYQVTTQSQLYFDFGPGRLMSSGFAEVKTIIIELDPNETLCDEVMETINKMASNDTIELQVKGVGPRTFHSPHIIVCAHDLDFYAQESFRHIEIVLKQMPVGEHQLEAGDMQQL